MLGPEIQKHFVSVKCWVCQSQLFSQRWSWHSFLGWSFTAPQWGHSPSWSLLLTVCLSTQSITINVWKLFQLQMMILSSLTYLRDSVWSVVSGRCVSTHKELWKSVVKCDLAAGPLKILICWHKEGGAPLLLLHQAFIPTKYLLDTRGSIFTSSHNLDPVQAVLAPNKV